jgi:triosephosphate isomerase
VKRMLVVGNWKMNVGEYGSLKPETGNQVDVVICPPFTALQQVRAAIEPAGIGLGGQNCHHEASGAFTGEISASMLAEAGCTWVIVGHSERRRDAGETNTLIGAKALAALAAGLAPIVCIGESLEQRETGETMHVVTTQVQEFVKAAGTGALAASVLAYEPIWAIGTGRAATAEQAQEVHAMLRTLCEEQYGLSPTILYGGSVTPDNAAELFAKVDIDGALVGGASLRADSFLAIVNAAATV